MRNVAPRTGADEIDIARDQHEFRQLVGAVYSVGGVGAILTRWRFEPEDVAKILAGEDLYLCLMTYGGPIQPMMLDIGGEMWHEAGRRLEEERRERGEGEGG